MSKTKALAYMRTSSATNVGEDKDSEARQREAISAFARRAGYEIDPADWFYDAAVKGTDSLESRPGFGALLDRIEGNGVRVVLIEDASRFARDLLTQELGIIMLLRLNVRLITSRGDDLTDTTDEMRVALRQIVGVFDQLEKARLVRKLAHGRERRRQTVGKGQGRKAHAELHPAAVAAAKRLKRKGLSLRQIAVKLAEAGHLSATGKPYVAASVRSMIAPRRTRRRAA